MLPGKKKCKILKQIRQEIAKANDIEFVTSECKHKGNCEGTCPKCEEELRYLESELEQRRNAGKKVSVASIVAGALLTALPGCMLPKSNGALCPRILKTWKPTVPPLAPTVPRWRRAMPRLASEAR